MIKADGEIVCLKPDEIDWAESAGNYVCLHVGGAPISCGKLLRPGVRLGERQFLRVHRSTLVNVDRIKTLKPSLYGDYAILLRDGPNYAEPGISRERAEAAGDGVGKPPFALRSTPFAFLRWCPIDKNEGIVKREVFLGGAGALPGSIQSWVVRTKTLEHDSLLSSDGTTRSINHRYGLQLRP